MDQGSLVKIGHLIVKALDTVGYAPQIAMWVHSSETDVWKLWIVTSKRNVDRHEFYRTIAKIVSNHRAELGDFSAGDVELSKASHPAMRGIASYIRAPGLIDARFSGNLFDGYYLPDGIILRSDLKETA